MWTAEHTERLSNLLYQSTILGILNLTVVIAVSTFLAVAIAIVNETHNILEWIDWRTNND